MKNKQDELIQKTLRALVDAFEQADVKTISLLDRWFNDQLRQGLPKKWDKSVQEMIIRLSSLSDDHQQWIDPCVSKWTQHTKQPYRVDMTEVMENALHISWIQSKRALINQPDHVRPDVLNLCNWYCRAQQQQQLAAKKTHAKSSSLSFESFDVLVGQQAQSEPLKAESPIWLMSPSELLHAPMVYEQLERLYHQQVKNCLDEGLDSKNAKHLIQWSVFVYSTVISAARHAQALDKMQKPFEDLSVPERAQQRLECQTLAQGLLERYEHTLAPYENQGKKAHRELIDKYKNLVLLRCYAELVPLTLTDTKHLNDTQSKKVSAKGLRAECQSAAQPSLDTLSCESVQQGSSNVWDQWFAARYKDKVSALRRFDASQVYTNKAYGHRSSMLSVFEQVHRRNPNGTQLLSLCEHLSVDQQRALILGSFINNSQHGALGVLLSKNIAEDLHDAYEYEQQEHFKLLEQVPQQLEHLKVKGLLDAQSARLLSECVVQLSIEHLMVRHSHKNSARLQGLEEHAWVGSCLKILAPYLNDVRTALQSVWHDSTRKEWSTSSKPWREQQKQWLKKGLEPWADHENYSLLAHACSTWHKALQCSDLPVPSDHVLAQKVCKKAQHVQRRCSDHNALVEFYGLIGHICAHLGVSLIERAALGEKHLNEQEKMQTMSAYLNQLLHTVPGLTQQEYTEHKSALEQWFLHEQMHKKGLIEHTEKRVVRL